MTAHTLSDEDKIAIANGEEWAAFGAKFGWTLRGWTFLNRASFWLDESEHHWRMIEIDKFQRASLEAALNKPDPVRTALLEALEGFEDWFHGPLARSLIASGFTGVECGPVTQAMLGKVRAAIRSAKGEGK